MTETRGDSSLEGYKQGQWRNMTFQVCDVSSPFASAHKIVEAGHSAVFNPSSGPRGSYIQNHNTGEETWLSANDGVYVLETTVASSQWQSSPSFGRRGR